MNKLIEFLSEPGPLILSVFIVALLAASFMYYQSEKTARLAIENRCDLILIPGSEVKYWGNCKK